MNTSVESRKYSRRESLIRVGAAALALAADWHMFLPYLSETHNQSELIDRDEFIRKIKDSYEQMGIPVEDVLLSPELYSEENADRIFRGTLKAYEHVQDRWEAIKPHRSSSEVTPFRTNVKNMIFATFPSELSFADTVYITNYITNSDGTISVMTTFYGDDGSSERLLQATNEAVHQLLDIPGDLDPAESPILAEAASDMISGYVVTHAKWGDPRTKFELEPEALEKEKHLIKTGWRNFITADSDKRYFANKVQDLFLAMPHGVFLQAQEHYGAVMAKYGWVDAIGTPFEGDIISSVMGYIMRKRDSNIDLPYSLTGAAFEYTISKAREDGHIRREDEQFPIGAIRQIALCSPVPIRENGDLQGPILHVLSLYQDTENIYYINSPSQNNDLLEPHFTPPGGTTSEFAYLDQKYEDGLVYFQVGLPEDQIHPIPPGSEMTFATDVIVDVNGRIVRGGKNHRIMFDVEPEPEGTTQAQQDLPEPQTRDDIPSDMQTADDTAIRNYTNHVREVMRRNGFEDQAQHVVSAVPVTLGNRLLDAA